MQTVPTSDERFAATNLEAVLIEQGRKQRWLAQQIGVSEHLISHVLAGRRTLGRDLAERVSSLLGVPFFVLFELRANSESRDQEQDSNAAD